MATVPAAQARRLEPDLEALAEAEGFALRPGPRQRIDPDTFDVLRFAIKARRKVRMDYRYRGSGRTGYQTVHPYGFLYGNRHYLVAYSENEQAQAVRMFALLNVTAVTLLDDAFVAQPGFSLRSFAGQSFGVFQERTAKVAWRFSAKAAPDAREFNFHPTQRFPPRRLGPGRRLTMRIRHIAVRLQLHALAYNLAKLHADPGIAEGGGALVADHHQKEVGQDLRQGRCSWPLRHVPDG